MKPYAHQQRIIDANPTKTGLWLGTGSGKTFIALTLAKGDILVIAPKTQVEDRNWEREYMKIIGDEVKKYRTNQKVRTVTPRLTVISKETFRRDSHLLPRFSTVIVDEAHTCLGVTPNTRQRMRVTVPRASQLFDALDTYLARTKPERLYLCTATIVRNPMTVWGARKILGHIPASRETLSDFLRWRETYYVRLPMGGREVFAPKKDNKVKDALAKEVRAMGFVGRLEDYFDVPDQTYRTIHVGLSAKQQARIKKLPLEFPDPLVLVGKKHQVENGILSGDEYTAGESFANEKIERILDLADEFPRMVVFAKYRAQISQIENALMDEGVRTWTLTGDTKDRGGIIKQANEVDGVLIVQAQVSAGWEVPQTPVMVFASRTYSFVDYVQGIGRIQRANNIKKNLYINLVVKGGIDEAVDKSLANKQDFDERIYLKQNNKI